MKIINKKARKAIATVEVMTPRKASEALNKVSSMNPCSSRGMSDMLRDMENGTWGLNAEAIIFDEEGELLNGFKLLRAIQTSGVSANALVVRDCPVEYAKYFGNGHMRPLLQRIRRCYRGMEWLNCHNTAATCFMDRMWHFMPTQDEKVLYLKEHKKAMEWVNLHYFAMESGFNKAAIRAAFMVALEAGVDKSILMALRNILQNDLFTPKDAYQNANFHQVKNYLRKYMRKEENHGKLFQKHIFQVVLMAIRDAELQRESWNFAKVDSCPYKVVGLKQNVIFDPACAAPCAYENHQVAAKTTKVVHSQKATAKKKKA